VKKEDVAISVIVPIFNEEKRIAECLKSLREQTYKDYEIIVVDGHSDDSTVKIAKKYADKVLFDNRKGAGSARNVGAKQARGEILAFIDGDCVADKQWLHMMKKNFNNGCIAVGGVLKTYDGRLRDRIIFLLTNNLTFRFTRFFHYYQLIGNNCAYAKKYFRKENGFRENMTLLEDLELGLRMRKHGKMTVDRKMVVNASSRRLQQKGICRGFLEFFKGYLKMESKEPANNDYFKEIEH
jgi:glycosyltransferase involved in cell wall biosynthesis